jgi:flagellar biosynthetic protein FlhB
MADNASAQERTEEATPRKRLQARRKGTVARSQDLTHAVVIVALMLVMPSALGNLGSALLKSVHHGLGHVPLGVGNGEVSRYFWSVLGGPLVAFAPILAVAMGTGIAMNLAQVGFVVSGEALQPNFNKLNPASGIKRLFSVTATVEGAKATLKSALFGYLAWSAIQAHWPELLSLGWSTTGAMFSVIGSILHDIFMKISIAWVAMAAMDYFFQRKQVDKQLRMTKQEVRQEMREMEQAPELRGALARRRRALSRGRMMEAVRTADVIVTNPTHFSVAIKYDHSKMYAPQVVAKGQDLIALKIREVAGENRVPIVPNPPLARQLYKTCEIGDFVPREMFQAVAEVLAYVYRTVRGQKA